MKKILNRYLLDDYVAFQKPVQQSCVFLFALSSKSNIKCVWESKQPEDINVLPKILKKLHKFYILMKFTSL